MMRECPVGLNSSKTICVTLHMYLQSMLILSAFLLTVYLFAFEFENGVTMSPKRCSFLSLLFTCLTTLKIKIPVRLAFVLGNKINYTLILKVANSHSLSCM